MKINSWTSSSVLMTALVIIGYLATKGKWDPVMAGGYILAIVGAVSSSATTMKK